MYFSLVVNVLCSMQLIWQRMCSLEWRGLSILIVESFMLTWVLPDLRLNSVMYTYRTLSYVVSGDVD
jgi:hypothetical protein